jgi:hypothetical protein
MKTGEQKFPGPQSASTWQLPGTQVLGLLTLLQAQTLPAGQSLSIKQVS